MPHLENFFTPEIGLILIINLTCAVVSQIPSLSMVPKTNIFSSDAKKTLSM